MAHNNVFTCMTCLYEWAWKTVVSTVNVKDTEINANGGSLSFNRNVYLLQSELYLPCQPQCSPKNKARTKALH